MKQTMKQSRYTVIFWLVCIKKGRRFTLPLLYINGYLYYLPPGIDGLTSTLLGSVRAGILIKSDTICPMSSG